MTNVLKAIAHCLAGCLPGNLLWRGVICKKTFEDGKLEVRHEEYSVYQCSKCRNPFLHWERVVEEPKRVAKNNVVFDPRSIPLEA